MKNILITGGAGFIGSNIALKLLSNGYNVRVFDNLSPQIHGNNPEETSPLYQSIKDKVEFIHGSVLSRDLWEQAILDQDAIIHLAAETGTGQSMYQVEHYCNVNIMGTAIMLDLLVNSSHKIKKVVVASSRSIYGEGKYESVENGIVYPGHRDEKTMLEGNFNVHYKGTDQLSPLPTDEESKIHPSSVYGITKQLQEQLILNVCGSAGIASYALRYQNVYGPGQSLSNPYTGILSIFSNLIRQNKQINIFEDGLESRDFVFIDDVVNCTIAALLAEGNAVEIVNVGTGVATTVLEVAKSLIKYIGIEVPLIVSGNFRKGDIRHNFADIRAMKQKLNYEPTISFDEGIEKFVAWVKTQPVLESKYESSLKEMKEKGLFK